MSTQLVARKVWGRLLTRVITVAFIIFFAWLTEQHWYFTFAMLLPVLLNLFFQVVAPIWVPDHGTYTERVERWMEHGDELEGKVLAMVKPRLSPESRGFQSPFRSHKGLRVAVSPFGPNINIVLYATLTLAIPGLLGQSVAKFQDVFMVSTSAPPCIVIRASSTGFLCEAFDRRSHSLEPRYRFFSEKDSEFTA